MRRIFTLQIAILSCLFSFAQSSGTISILVQTKSQPLENASVELLKANDSTLVKTAITETTGKATFEHIPAGRYLIRATMTGFAAAYSESFSTEGVTTSFDVTPITLTTATTSNLQSVTVTAKKPFIQKLSDRIVVNVESSIVSAGSSVLEVLERSPGVTVDQNDAISLRGRAGVIIMFDGKPTPMTGADLANYLKSLPANAIERIDIITNPSAKYDAAGNSGIIDIRFKKDQRLGTNGTFNAGYTQGIYPKVNTGASLNYRNKKVNIFGSYNYGYRKLLNHLLINRNFYENGVFEGSDNKDNYASMPFSSHTARAGIDFFPSKKTILGFVVNSSFNTFSRNANITTEVFDAQLQPDFRFSSVSTNNDHFGNTVANFNFKHTFDTTGRELTADIDMGVFNSGSLTRTASSFYNLNGSRKKEDDILDGDQDGKLILRTAKADYVRPLSAKARLEAGFKTSYVSSDNDAKFYNVFNTGSQPDLTKTNRFYYKEYNNAVYTNLHKDFNKLDAQVGLRAEQTNIRTRQVKGNRSYRNDYLRLFPSAFLNYKLTQDQTLGVSVSRRIDRPGYSALNPFLFQVDATIYSTGDPLLKPEMTWSYELNYTIKNTNLTFGYSRTTDPQNVVLSRILNVIPNFEIKPGQDSNITVQIPVNLTSSDYVGLTATTPVRISKWWNMINNFNLYYNHFNGNLGGAQLNNGSPAASVRTNNSFTFRKGWSAELNANFNSGGRSGYMVMKSQWGLAAGAQKAIMKGKGNLRVNVTDIFWTNLPRATVTYEGSYIEHWHAYRDTRAVNLSFNYRFGNSKVQAARKRETASEEERQRAGN